MIPKLRDFGVRVHRHYASHQVLRDFCATLYACRAALGDAAASDDWLRFIRPIWNFHSIATAVPLPLNHEALLSKESGEAIEREALRVRNRVAGVRDTVDHVCETLSACRRSDVNPLGETLQAMLAPASAVAVLLPYDDARVLCAIREAVAVPSSALLLSRGEQREHRDSFRRGLPLVVIGKLANVDPALLRAPLADCTIDVLLYNWANDKSASELAGPSLTEMIPDRATEPSTKFVQVIDDDRPTRNVANVDVQATTQPDAMTLEARPFVLPDVDLLRAVPSATTDSEDRNEMVLALVLVLTDESARPAATLVEVDDPILVLRPSPEDWSSIEVRAIDAIKGDLYIQKTTPGDHTLIEEMADEALAREGHRDRLEAQQLEWKALLSARIKALGLPAVTRSICKHCDGWRPGQERVLEWVRSDTIGPQQKQAFRAVCRFLGISDGQANEYWRAMRAIQNARIAAGRDLSHRMLERVLEECRDRGLNFREATKISIGERATTVYPIEFVSAGIRTVARSSLGFVFPIEDIHLDPSTNHSLV